MEFIIEVFITMKYVFCFPRFLDLSYRHEGPDDREDGPDEDSERHDHLPGVPVSEVAEDGREHHVGDDEGRLEGAALRVGDVVLGLDLGQDAWKGRKYKGG